MISIDDRASDLLQKPIWLAQTFKTKEVEIVIKQVLNVLFWNMLKYGFNVFGQSVSSILNFLYKFGS